MRSGAGYSGTWSFLFTITDNMMKKKIILILALSFLFINPYLTNAVGKDGGIRGQETEDLKKQTIQKKDGDFFFGYLNLVGTVLLSEDDRKLNKAIFQDVFSRKKVTYHEGSPLPYGIKLKRVNKDKVILEKKGREKSLSLRDKNNYFRDIKALKRYGYRQIDNNEWVVNSHYLFRNSEDMIKTAVDSGLALKRLSMNPGIELGKNADKKMVGLGFQKGDKVIDINGTRLDGITGISSAYKKMKNSENISIKIIRNGKPVELKYWVAKRGAPRYNMKQVLNSDKIRQMLF